MPYRLTMFAFSSGVYALFHVTFVALVAFVLNLAPWTGYSLVGGEAMPTTFALVTNVGLVLLFGVQHTVMARTSFKSALERLLPAAVERSVFILATCGVLWLTILAWQPMPTVLWQFESVSVRAVLIGLALAGWAVVPAASFLLDHFEFTGLRQTWTHLRGTSLPVTRFRTPGLYSAVRHPMLLGVLVGLWSTPTMTVSHLVFACGFSIYIAIGVRFEERDLVRHFGEEYEEYRRTTPMIVPGLPGTSDGRVTRPSPRG